MTKLRRLATELAFAGKHKKAADLYEHILQLSPTDGQIALRLAEARRRSGEVERALEAYERAAVLFRSLGLDGKAQAAARLVEELSLELGETETARGANTWWRRLRASWARPRRSEVPSR
ncbi:MAG TPA: tetratricopeptide repeat protein [Polyangia bacterium]|nr:tetratricopeptide repeat protein [Polyangia bacterium]